MKEHKRKEAGPLGPLSILRWVLLAPINLILILMFQALFVHTQAAPLTPERLATLPVFSGCEILDIAGPKGMDNDTLGANDRSWILYRNAAEETHVVRVEWNMILPRYRIETSVDFLIPAEESSYTVTARDLLGETRVIVENGQNFTNYGYSGGVRQQDSIIRRYVLVALGLILIEAGIYNLIRKARIHKQNDHK